MRAICRGAIACVLVALLANFPAEAAVSRALGFVQAAQGGLIDGIPATGGTNIVPGDVLTTNSDGALQLQFGANRLYVPGASTISLANGNKGDVIAVLSNGSVEFRSPQGAGMEVEAADVLIRPKTAQMTRAQVSLLAKNELKIATVSGPLEIELDGQTYTLDAGKTYGVRIVDAAENAQYTESTSARKRRGLVIFLFATTAAVAGIIFLVQELHESPDVP